MHFTNVTDIGAQYLQYFSSSH